MMNDTKIKRKLFRSGDEQIMKKVITPGQDHS